jgi:DNA invertase Pin-like site-specific DNA recombinase
MKVAIYTRVSGKSNKQDAANQSLQLIEYCQRQGWDYVEYTDRMSGTKADRTASSNSSRMHASRNLILCCSGRSTGSAAKGSPKR